MEVKCSWNGKKDFVGNIHGYRIRVGCSQSSDDSEGLLSNEIILMKLCSRIGMTVIKSITSSESSILKFEITARPKLQLDPIAGPSTIDIIYSIEGSCEPQEVLNGLSQAQSEYKSALFNYELFLNKKLIGRGSTDFQTYPRAKDNDYNYYAN